MRCDFLFGWLGQVAADFLDKPSGYGLRGDVGFGVHSCGARAWTHVACGPVVFGGACLSGNPSDQLLCAFDHCFQRVGDVLGGVSHENHCIHLACANRFSHRFHFFGGDAIVWHLVGVEYAADSAPELGSVRQFGADAEVGHKLASKEPAKRGQLNSLDCLVFVDGFADDFALGVLEDGGDVNDVCFDELRFDASRAKFLFDCDESQLAMDLVFDDRADQLQFLDAFDFDKRAVGQGNV